MKGIDTNILVRYLVRDDDKQAKIASACIRKIIASGEACFVNVIVLCELVWVLESAYGFRRREIAEVLEKILMTKQFEIESKEIVRLAVSDYRDGQADFADYIIGRTNHLRGCDVTFTFDRSLKIQSEFVVLE
jgi:predicted nucleic-acid-binding protein